VLLSSKEGDAKLELCPDFSNHGGMSSKMHTAPKKFNRQNITKLYGEVATPKQYTEAGWKQPSKSPKK